MITYQKYLFKYFMAGLFLSLVMISCAKIGSLSGGPKDLKPPVIDTLLSDKNFQVRFYPEKIVLYFDEWREL